MYSIHLQISKFCSAHGQSTLITKAAVVSAEAIEPAATCHCSLQQFMLSRGLYGILPSILQHLQVPGVDLSVLLKGSVFPGKFRCLNAVGLMLVQEASKGSGHPCQPQYHGLYARGPWHCGNKCYEDACGWTNLHQPKTRGRYCTLPLGLWQRVIAHSIITAALAWVHKETHYSLEFSLTMVHGNAFCRRPVTTDSDPPLSTSFRRGYNHCHNSQHN